MNNVQIFKNAEFGSVRTASCNGKIVFCGKDIAMIFGYKNPLKAIRDHCKGVNELDTPTSGGIQKMKFISEGDIYRLAVKSELPNTDKFESWIFDEVIPTIRKTGGYVANDNMFIDTYLPFADDATKMLFKATLEAVNKQNEIIENQKKEITHKKTVIQGFADDVSLSDKRQIINKVMRYNTKEYKKKWALLYDEFDKTFHINTEVRYNNYIESGLKPKYKNKLDFVDRKLNMFNELYGVAVKLFESDVEKIKARYDVYSNAS